MLLLFSLLLTTLVYSASYEDAVTHLRLKELQGLKGNTWNFGMTLIREEAGTQKSPVMDIWEYASLPDSKKAELRQNWKKLSALEKLTEPDIFLENNQKIQALEKDLLKEFSPPGKAKKLITGHFGRSSELDPDLIDGALGIDYAQTEKSISKIFPSWALVDVRKIYSQSWYGPIRDAFKLAPLGKDDVFYDLGSGYGRVIFYGATVYPKTSFKGVEIVGERVDVCEKIRKHHDFKNVTFFSRDVLKHDFSDGTHFYFFNPFPGIMPEVLSRLEALAKKKKITIIAWHQPGDVLLTADWVKLVRGSSNFQNLRVFESVSKE